ncbi:MAG TPA: GNAT family N-acetyltransferase [Actinomycetota bacterium]|nr:GNAT family N-acetyltransferase [Actinomycetota bacterium]
MSVEIHPVRPEEHAEAGAVVVAAYMEFFEPGHEGWERYLVHLGDVAGRAERSIVLVAVEDGRMLGCATVELDEPISGGESDLGPDEARLRMLGVLPETRGRGIGEALTRAAIEAARERGRTRMVLNSAEYMTQAHRIYERLGFSREPDWVGEDGFRMRTYSMDLPG